MEEINGFKIKPLGGKYLRKTKGFTPKIWESDKERARSAWKGIHRRCYYKRPETISYLGCSVHEDWHNFENFYSWWQKQYKEVDWQIDKDILLKGNKVYSEATCCLVPRQINMLFTKTNGIRGKLPIGVCKAHNKFKAYINKFGEKIHLGTYPTIEQAFEMYKFAKEEHIKYMATEVYGDVLRQDVKDVLLNYVVSIDD